MSLASGVRLADRYRLDERYAGTHALGVGETVWWATDDFLCRPVWVHLLPSETARAGAAARAARAAGRISDRRFVRILDVRETAGLTCIVSEAIQAPTLADLLADGPLSPGQARALAASVAQALSVAAAFGLSHARLRPEDIFCREDDIVISGLAIAATLDPCPQTDSQGQQADARGCAALLHAALTGAWPLLCGSASCGSASCGSASCATSLPAAIRCGGRVCSPRQVRAGVPADLDAVVRRALGGIRRRGETVLSTPAEIAQALQDQPGPARPQLPPAPAPARPDPHLAVPPVAGAWRRERAVHPPAQTLPGPDGLAGPAPDASSPILDRLSAPLVPGTSARAASLSAAVILAAGLALAAGQLGLVLLGRAVATDPISATGATPGIGPGLGVVDVYDLDPGSRSRSDSSAMNAIDGDLETAWRTRIYAKPSAVDGVQAGSGLVLDLGSPHRVASVQLVLLGRSADVELRAADSPGLSPQSYRLVRAEHSAGSRVALDPSEPLTTRYLLVRLTRLPGVPQTPGAFRGGIAEITLSG